MSRTASQTAPTTFTGFTKPSRLVIAHLAGWLFYLSLEIATVLFAGFPLSRIGESLLFYVLNISLFYAMLGVFDATLSGARKRYVKMILLASICLLACSAGKAVLDYLLIIPAFPAASQGDMLKRYIIADAFRSAEFAGLAALYWFALNLGLYEKKAGQAHSAFLQQQLSPHLLLNTLSFVHGKIHQVSPPAGECVVLLSEVVRYGLEATANDGKTALSEELRQLQNLIAINRFRFGDDLQVQLSQQGAPQSFRIMPLTLLTLGENLFKHGLLTDKRRPARIGISIAENGELIYQSENAKKAAAPFTSRMARVGLSNLKLRLDTVYGTRYILQIKDHEDSYQVLLKITL